MRVRCRRRELAPSAYVDNGSISAAALLAPQSEGPGTYTLLILLLVGPAPRPFPLLMYADSVSYPLS